MNIALVGFGLAGRTFHAPLIQSVNGLNLQVIISSQRKEIGELYPDTIVSTEFNDALADSIDTVVIATPNELHFEQVKQALIAGKNVVVDKPIASSSVEIAELIKLSKTYDKFISVFHNRRFDGDFITLQKIIKSKQLGNIRMLESNFNRFRPVVDQNNWRETTTYAGGILFDLGPHLIDQAVSLFGKPKRIFCDIKKQRINAVNDDYFHMILDYKNIVVHLNASALTKNVRERFVLQGEFGSYSKYGMDVQEGQLKNNISPLSEKFGKDSEESFGILKINESEQKVVTERGNYLKYYQEVSKGVVPVNANEALVVSTLLEACIKSSEKEKWITL
jgi:scyllo-inositol 2-dehydrogenase (NADP+)